MWQECVFSRVTATRRTSTSYGLGTNQLEAGDITTTTSSPDLARSHVHSTRRPMRCHRSLMARQQKVSSILQDSTEHCSGATLITLCWPRPLTPQQRWPWSRRVFGSRCPSKGREGTAPGATGSGGRPVIRECRYAGRRTGWGGSAGAGASFPAHRCSRAAGCFSLDARTGTPAGTLSWTLLQEKEMLVTRLDFTGDTVSDRWEQYELT